jgi:16S rRNA (guanine527-N7)-methyltransferase
VSHEVASPDFRKRLRARAESAQLALPTRLFAPLEAYHLLLAKWNVRINLTALELDPLSDAAVDRLFVEPLSAARFLPRLPKRAWFDIGSGGGSPAIPLLLASPALQLTMIESRQRKASFLREVVRTLDLSAVVEGERFEKLPISDRNQAGLVTARAVRIDAGFLEAACRMLCPSGVLALFGGDAIDPDLLSRTTLTSEPPVELLGGAGNPLRVFRNVPRGTQIG